MVAIARGVGVTESERYLAKLADQTFLRLWSYPNTFIDKKQAQQGIGKELADLLVVCGDNILIFSDKAVEWPTDDPPELAWSRWYRRAIEKSIAQIRGAERWITKFPNRIFLDPKCAQPFPIDLPPAKQRRVHGIIVAIGATDAVRMFCDDDSGTFLINGLLKGGMHTASDSPGHLPFSFGDVDPSGSFIHVFDPTALDIIMRELDTVSDLTEYLHKRSEFIRSGRFSFAAGEEDLLAYYLQTLGENESHEFIPANLMPELAEHAIQIAPGEYNAFVESSKYKGRKIADHASYIWDRLIDRFIEHILAGTSVTLLDQEPDTVLAERGLRQMALENRVYRRLLGNAVSETLLKARNQKAQRFVRTILPGKYAHSRRIAYVLLVLAYPKDVKLENGYADYRAARANMLQLYCLNLFDQTEDIDFAIGIAVDAAPEVTGRAGGSEDLVAIERPEWTEELRGKLEVGRKLLNIKSITSANLKHVTTTEYPQPAERPLSRQQRRAKERAQRKAERSRTRRQ